MARWTVTIVFGILALMLVPCPAAAQNPWIAFAECGGLQFEYQLNPVSAGTYADEISVRATNQFGRLLVFRYDVEFRAKDGKVSGRNGDSGNLSPRNVSSRSMRPFSHGSIHDVSNTQIVGIRLAEAKVAPPTAPANADPTSYTTFLENAVPCVRTWTTISRASSLEGLNVTYRETDRSWGQSVVHSHTVEIKDGNLVINERFTRDFLNGKNININPGRHNITYRIPLARLRSATFETDERALNFVGTLAKRIWVRINVPGGITAEGTSSEDDERGVPQQREVLRTRDFVDLAFGSAAEANAAITTLKKLGG